jgi:hypothetical protein
VLLVFDQTPEVLTADRYALLAVPWFPSRMSRSPSPLTSAIATARVAALSSVAGSAKTPAPSLKYRIEFEPSLPRTRSMSWSPSTSPSATAFVAVPAVPIVVPLAKPTHAPFESGWFRNSFVALPVPEAPTTRSVRPSPSTSPAAIDVAPGVVRFWFGVSSKPSHGCCAPADDTLSSSAPEIASAICAL